MITPALFKKYHTAKDFADAPRTELEQLIKSAGFFHSKAKNIQNCCRKLVELHGGEVPRTMEELHSTRRCRSQNGERCFGKCF
jgi:endonuclease-3